MDRGPASSPYPVAPHPGFERIEQCSAWAATYERSRPDPCGFPREHGLVAIAGRCCAFSHDAHLKKRRCLYVPTGKTVLGMHERTPHTIGEPILGDQGNPPSLQP